MEEQEIFDRLEAIRDEITDKVTRAQAVGAIIRDATDGIQEDPVFNEVDFQAKLDIVQTYLNQVNGTQGNDDEGRLIAYATSVGPYLEAENGFVDDLPVLSIAAEDHHIIDKFGVWDMDMNNAANVVLVFDEDDRGVVYFRVKNRNLLTGDWNLNIRYSTGQPLSVVPIAQYGWYAIAVHPLKTPATYWKEVISKGSLGYLPPLVTDEILSESYVVDPENGRTSTIQVKGSPVVDNYKRVEVFGSISSDDAPTAVPEGPAPGTQYSKHLYISSKPAMVDRNKGVSFSNVENFFGGESYLSSDTINLGVLTPGSKIETFSYGDFEYAVVGSAVSVDGLIRLYKVGLDGGLTEMSSFDSFETVALHVISSGTHIYVLNWNKDGGTGVTHVDVYRFNKGTGQMASVGTTALSMTSFAGAVPLRYNGVVYFCTWSSDPEVDSELLRYNASNSTVTRMTEMESVKYHTLKSIVVIKSHDTDFPVIAGLPDDIVNPDKEVHYLEAIAKDSMPFGFDAAASRVEIITTQTSTTLESIVPKQMFYLDSSTVKNALIVTATDYGVDPDSNLLDAFVIDGPAGVTDDDNGLGNYHVVKPVIINGVLYALAAKMDATAVDLIQFNDAAAYFVALTIPATDTLDVAYVFSMNKHLLLYTTDAGQTLEVAEFSTEKSMVDWRSIHIDEDLVD